MRFSTTSQPFSRVAVLLLALAVAALLLVEFTTAFSVAGKTVLVTGSAGGIGKAIARALAEKGAKIIVHYHTREQEAHEFSKELGPEKCLGVLHCDFRDISSIQAFFQKATDLCPNKLDILVNNAGAITKLPMEDDDNEITVWQETLAVNLHAPALLGKLFASQFKDGQHDECDANDETTRGVILNVGSIHGDRSNEFMGAYAASKAGLESLTRTQAIEYASLQLRANLIAPGIVPVERTQATFAASPHLLEAWNERIPVGRPGTVEQVAHASFPLIENDWITGTVWQIDGGMMARANMPIRTKPQ